MSLQKKIKIVITEDNVIWRTSVRKSIEETSESGIQIIAEAGNGLELAEILKTHSPDIILLDLEMPGMAGNETLYFLKANYPTLKVIIVSQYDNPLLMEDYYSRGVQGYLSKSQAGDIPTLIKIIHKVNTGKSIIGNYERPQFELSETQKEIVRLKAQGKTNGQVSVEIGISGSGVSKQIGKIKKKMGIIANDTWLVHIAKTGLQYLTKPFR